MRLGTTGSSKEECASMGLGVLLLVGAAVVFGSLAGGACADDEASSGPTVSEFVEQADALCQEYDSRIQRAAPGPATLALQVELLNALVALPRPAILPSALQRVLAALDESAGRATARPGEGFQGVPISVTDIRASGFTQCGAD